MGWLLLGTIAAQDAAQRAAQQTIADASGNLPGTGLGMAIVAEVVVLDAGELQVHSRLGAGTTVTIWLPRV